MRKYTSLILFVLLWPVLSTDVHGQIYAPDRMSVSQFMNTTGADQQSPEHRSWCVRNAQLSSPETGKSKFSPAPGVSVTRTGKQG